MARTYAAIMALLAMLVVLLRAMKGGAGFDGTITTGLIGMALMAVVGLMIGAIAQQTVDVSVQSKIEAELAGLSKKTNEQEPSTN